ncbi:hypothetical protein HYW21_06925 [Candidatus Woesearchaeota archaeon]|nr:hypothetical protein [Candidatus Woesearchaeota archaeon]
MLTGIEPKKLYDDIAQQRKEITQLKETLDHLNEQKEVWFAKKASLQETVSQHLQELREQKHQRNVLTTEVRQLKEERKKIHEEIKAKIPLLQEQKKSKQELMKKYPFKEDPSTVTSRIAALETKIETEPMSFDREKEIMKKIKDLKRRFAEVKDINEVSTRIHAIAGELREFRKEADRVHQKIQEKALESQKHHEAYLQSAEKIKELRSQEEEAYKQFVSFKQQFSDVNHQLKTKLDEVRALQEKVSEQKLHAREEKEEKTKQRIEDKEKIVQEKIKKRQKLTTEDLLVFQKAEENKEQETPGKKEFK